MKFYQIEERRQLKGQETVLPLQELLQNKYVGIFDFKMSSREQTKTKKNLLYSTLMLTPILITVAVDHYLIKQNEFLSKNAIIEISNPNVNNLNDDSDYETNNPMQQYSAKLFKGLNKQYPTFSSYISNRHCIPVPSNPEDKKEIYKTIQANGVIIFLMALVGVYVERMRSVLAGSIYLERDEERNNWLYSHMLEVKLLTKSFVKEPDANIFKKMYSSVAYFVLNVVFKSLCNLSCYWCCFVFERVSLKQFFMMHEAKFMWLLEKCRTSNEHRCSKCMEDFEEKNELLRCKKDGCKVK